MDKRTLGRTGEKLSIIGFGGMLVNAEEPAEAARLVSMAVNELGINYFDVAPTYGNAEERLGPALEPYRKRVFLACKTMERSAEGAAAALHRSLALLHTDHLDLYQFHAVTTMEEVDEIMGPGGALEAYEDARRKGLIRYIGFSAHSEEAALALLDRYDFDSILFPFSWTIWHQGHFGPRVLARAQEKGVGILALKAMAKRQWAEGETHDWSKTWYRPVESFEEAELALRFTLSRPVTAALTPGHEQFLRWACDIAEDLRPLTPEEEALVARDSQGLAPLFTS